MHHSHQSFATRRRLQLRHNEGEQVIWFTDARPAVAFDQTPEAFEVIDPRTLVPTRRDDSHAACALSPSGRSGPRDHQLDEVRAAVPSPTAPATIAAVRSPFETAMAAIDMDRLSNGRFVLGLGPRVHAWTSGIFGAPHYKPVSHLRETVAAIRHIVAGAHQDLAPFRDDRDGREDYSRTVYSMPSPRNNVTERKPLRGSCTYAT